jgi:hypothetical protein
MAKPLQKVSRGEEARASPFMRSRQSAYQRQPDSILLDRARRLEKANGRKKHHGSHGLPTNGRLLDT